MSTLTPIRPTARPEPVERVEHREAPPAPRSLPRIARWGFVAVQAAWLVALIAAAVAIGGSAAGFAALWLAGAAVVSTLGFGYRELVLHDRPQPSSSR